MKKNHLFLLLMLLFAAVGGYSQDCVPITVSEDEVWFNDFESVSGNGAVAFDNCWATPVKSSFSAPFNYCNHAPACHSGSNSVEIKGNNGEMCMLVLPEFSSELNTLRFSFYGNTTASSAAAAGIMELGYMTDVADTSTFVSVWTITPPSNCLSRANSVFFGNYDYPTVPDATGRIAFRWVSTGSGATSWNLDDFTVSTAPPCPEPSNLSIANVTSTSVEVSWLENTDESYEIAYCTGVDTMYESASQTDGHYLLSGLNPGTSYSVFVRVYCSDNDSYVNSLNSVSFNTPGEPISLPFERTFEEDASEMTEFTFSGSGVNQWAIGSAAGVGESDEDVHSLYISNDNGASNAYTLNNTSSAYAVIDMEFPDENLEWHLSFDYKVNGQATIYSWASYYYDYLSVYLMNGGAEIPSSGAPSGTALLYQACNVADWTHVDYTLENVAGTSKRLVFYWVNNSSSGNQPPAAIDNISIDGSSCIQPSGFTVQSVGTEDVALSWTENGSATDWVVFYREKGVSEDFNQENVSGIPEATIYGLNPNTRYEYYVVADCGGEYSKNNDLYEFQTACGPKSVSENPWVADFEVADNEALNCWLLPATGFYNNKTFPSAVASASVVHSGSKALEIAFGNIVAALPEFAEDLSTLQISFWSKRNSYSAAYANNTILEFGYITNPSDTSTFVALDTLNFTTYTKTDRTFAGVADLNLPSETRMAFRFNQINSDNLTSWYVDDITVSVIPSCAAPNGNSVTVSNVDDMSAMISFVDDDVNHDTWEISYKVSDSEEEYMTLEVYEQNNNLIEGLQSNTTYVVFVKTICSGVAGDNQTEPITFTTTTVPATLPLNVDFEDADENQQWVLQNGTQNNKWYIAVPTDSESDVNTTDGGEYGLYVSNDNGASNKYSSSSIVYAYRDILVPDGTTDLVLSFDWKAMGGSEKNEFLRVYWLDPSVVTLTPGSNPPTVGGVNYDAAGQPGNFGVDATEHWLSRQNTWQHKEMLISAGQFAGMGDGDKVYRLAFQWRSTYYSTNPPAAVDNVSLQEAACNTPTNLAVSGVEETSATASWNGDSPEYSVMIIGTDTVFETTSDNEIYLSDLDPSSAYAIYVRGLCGDDSSMLSSPVSFYTACGAISLQAHPWTADFEGTDEILNCWASASTGSRNGYTYPHIEHSSLIAHSSAAALEIAFGNIVTALPLFAEPLEEIQVSFWAKSNRWSGQYPIILGYITEPYDSTTFVGLDTLEFNNYTQISKSFASLAGLDIPSSSRIAFKYNQGESSNLTSWYIDDMVVSLIPDCAAPQHNSVTVTNVTDNSAIVSFVDDDDNHDAWMLYYREIGTDSEYNQVPVDAEEGNLLEGLEPNTSYSLFVRTVCDGVDGDDQTDSVVFFTTSTPASLPLSADFEDMDENEQWVLLNGTQTNKWYVGTPEDSESDVNTTEGGSNGLYVSNDNGASNKYSTSTSRVYACRDILVPDGTTELLLSFDWKSYGNNASYEFLRVYWYDPSVVTVTPGNNPPTVGGVNYDYAAQPGYYGENPSSHHLARQNEWQHTEMLITSEQFAGMGDGDRVFRLAFHWRNESSSVQNPPAAVDNVLLKEVLCATPTNLAVSDITETSATLSWNGEADSYVATVSSNGTSETYTTNSNSLLLENLSSSTYYDVTVKAFCGDDSSMMSQTVSFMTNCSAINTLPYSNDFDTYSMIDGTNYISCWSRLASNPSRYVYANTQFNHTPGGSAALDFNYTSGCYTIAVLPQLGDNISLQELQADFYAYKNGANGTFDIGVMTDPADASTFTVYYTIDFASTHSWEHFVVKFDQYAGSGKYIAFRSNDAAITSYVIDDLTLEEITECSIPTALAVTTASITETSATATWTAGGSETAWKLQYKAASATQWGNEIAVNTTPSYQMTGLTAGTNYQVRVKAVCDGGSESAWTSPVNFTTSSAAVVEPTVATNNAQSVTQTTAVLNGEITNPGNQTITARGFEWKAAAGGTVATVNATGTTTFSANLTGLTAGTEYTFRAYATTAGGNSYGDWKNFTTSTEPVEPCNMPTNVTVADFDKESITLTWDANGAEKWAVQYRKQGATAWTLGSNNITATTYIISGLEEATVYEYQVQAICDGTTSEWTQVASQTTGIDSRLLESIKLYPNPASDYVEVRVSDNDVKVSRLEVYDVYGKLLNEVEVIDNPTRINVSSLSNGMYYVRVITENGVATKNFIKR